MSVKKGLAVGLMFSLLAGATQVSALAPPREDLSYSDTVAVFIRDIIPASNQETYDFSGLLVEEHRTSEVSKLPQLPSDPIAINLGSDDQIDFPFHISLPKLEGLGRGEVAYDGTVVYGSSESVSVAVQGMRDGLRILKVLTDSTSPETYVYPVDVPSGASITSNDDGSASVYHDGVLVMSIAAPWAVDSEGNWVDTHYIITHNAITQVINHKDGDYSYPVVADPRLTYGFGVYLNLTGVEIKTVATALVAAGGASALAVCSGLSKLPGAISKVANLVCTAVGAPTLSHLYRSIDSLWRSTGITNAACYQTKLVGPRTHSWTVVPFKGNCSA